MDCSFSVNVSRYFLKLCCLLTNKEPMTRYLMRSYFILFKKAAVLLARSLRGIMAKILDCLIVVSEFELQSSSCSVGSGCWIHRLHLWRRVKLPPNECPDYVTKQWGMRSTPSLPSLPNPLWPGEVSLYRVLSMGQIELNCVLMQNWIARNRTVFDIKTVLTLNWIFWNRIVWLNWIA